MRHDAADFFAFLVLLADVHEAGCWTTGLILELIVIVGCSQKALARQG
jgi:hypothetical protein